MQPSNGQNLWQPQGNDAMTPQPNLENSDLKASSFEPITWEASESIHHERDTMWFVGFIAIFVCLIGVSILLQQWTFTALLVIMAIALMIYINRPPRILKYSLNTSGIQIGEEIHSFSEFHSFGILQEGSIFSIMLMPTKRFGQALTIYFSEADGEKIVDILGSHLPMEDLHLDIMDNLLRRLRL